VKQAFFAYVNHARILSWNHPVINNEGEVSCSFDGDRTHDWQASTDYKTRYTLRLLSIAVNR